MASRIELLTESLIDERPDLALEVLAHSSRLAIPLGWHYLLDIAWVLRELEGRPPGRLLEIGGGTGLIQFILAGRGWEVISADMRQRTLPPRLAHLFRIKVLKSSRAIEHDYINHIDRKTMKQKLLAPAKAAVHALRGRSGAGAARKVASRPGAPLQPEITFYQCEASSMVELADGSVDAVISISALEHNTAENARKVIAEGERIVKPGGVILHTTSAVAKGGGFHEESFSWLYDEKGLAELYNLNDYETNYAEAERIDAEFRQPRHLARWLSWTYFADGKNGMPWGIWDPKYLPVGVRKEVKAT